MSEQVDPPAPGGEAPGAPGEPPAQGWTPPPQPGGWQGPPPAPPDWQQPPAQGWTPPPPPTSWSPPPQQGPATGIAYADFFIRLVAYIIDAVILVIPGAILTAVFVRQSLTVNFTTGEVSVDVAGLLIVTVIQAAISAAYFIYTWTSLRASPGQKVLGMMVLNEADGSTITPGQAVTRWLILAGAGALSNLVYGYSGLGPLIGLLVFAWYIYLAYTTATDPKRQGFHDRAAHTVVVRATLQQ